MDEVERSVNEVNRMLGDPDVNPASLNTQSSRRGGSRSKVCTERYFLLLNIIEPT